MQNVQTEPWEIKYLSTFPQKLVYNVIQRVTCL